MATPRATKATSAIAWIVASLVCAAACGDDAGAGSASGTIRLELVDPDGRLVDLEPVVRDTLAATLALVTPALGLQDLEITVATDASRAILGYGVGGFTTDGRHVRLDVDPDFVGIESVVAERLAVVCTHELHHARRFLGPGYGATLLEALVSEGLADHFAVEVQRVAPPPWTEAFPPTRNDEILAIARAELDSSSYDHARWFFGTSADLPRWTGYTLGYRLVGEHLARNPDASAASLVEETAEVFRPGP